MQDNKQQLGMEKWTGSKLGKEYVYCHPAYLNSMQSSSCEMPAGKESTCNAGDPHLIPG